MIKFIAKKKPFVVEWLFAFVEFRFILWTLA